MENTELAQQVLDVADFDRAHFSMNSWGIQTACGTVACLGGHAMLLSGYTVDTLGAFWRPNGTKVPYNFAGEAECLLGMSAGEANQGGCEPLWYDVKRGVDRFRALTEASGKAKASGGQPDAMCAKFGKGN